MAGLPPAAGAGGADLSRSVSEFELDRRAGGEACSGLVIGLAAARRRRNAPFDPRAATRRSKLFIGNVVSAGSNAIVYVGKYNNEVRPFASATYRSTCFRKRCSGAAACAPSAPGRALARQLQDTAAHAQPGRRGCKRGEGRHP